MMNLVMGVSLVSSQRTCGIRVSTRFLFKLTKSRIIIAALGTSPGDGVELRHFT